MIAAITAALTFACLGGVAVAGTYAQLTSSEEKVISNCKYQATIRGEDPSHKGKGMSAFARRLADGRIEYSYRITKPGLRFFKAAGYADNSFSAYRIRVRRTSRTRGYFRNSIPEDERGDIREVTFCAK